MRFITAMRVNFYLKLKLILLVVVFGRRLISLGKEYEKGISYDAWISLLQEVIGLHYSILKPGGFLVINIADILCFQD